jgi:hypothetical protein
VNARWGNLIFWGGTGLAIAWAAAAAALDVKATAAAFTPGSGSCWELNSTGCGNYLARHDLPAVILFAAAWAARRLLVRR